VNVGSVSSHPNINAHANNARPNTSSAAGVNQSQRLHPAVEVALKYTVSEENLARYSEQFNLSAILSEVSTIRPGMSSNEKAVVGRAFREAITLLVDLRDNGYLSDTDVNNAYLALSGQSHQFSPDQISISSTGSVFIMYGSGQEAWDKATGRLSLGKPDFQTLEHVLNLTAGNVSDYLAERYDADTINSFFRISNIFNQIFDVNAALVESMNKPNAD